MYGSSYRPAPHPRGRTRTGDRRPLPGRRRFRSDRGSGVRLRFARHPTCPAARYRTDGAHGGRPDPSGAGGGGSPCRYRSLAGDRRLASSAAVRRPSEAPSPRAVRTGRGPLTAVDPVRPSAPSAVPSSSVAADQSAPWFGTNPQSSHAHDRSSKVNTPAHSGQVPTVPPIRSLVAITRDRVVRGGKPSYYIRDFVLLCIIVTEPKIRLGGVEDGLETIETRSRIVSCT